MLNTIFANDVRQTLDQFRRSVDQMFDQVYGPVPSPGARSNSPQGALNGNERTWTFSPVIESGWNDQQLHLRAILPGVAQQDLNVTLKNQQLVIEGERKAPEAWQNNSYTQMAYGRFYTAVTLPTGLDIDHMDCRLQNGILEISIPMSESSKPKQIPIHTGEERKAIHA